MALYAFDGTWNSVKSEEDKAYDNTNVVRFFRAYNKGRGDKDFYVEGVGTRFDLLGKLVGGFFGMGELVRINEAYDHLCQQWANGDKDDRRRRLQPRRRDDAGFLPADQV